MLAARLAPSAMNMQPWKLEANTSGVSIFERSVLYKKYAPLDRGICMLHAAVGAYHAGREAIFKKTDGGYLMREYTSMLSSPEMKQAMQAYGMTADQLMEGLTEFANTSPIMTALNIMTMNITIGLIFSLPVSLITRRARK